MWKALRKYALGCDQSILEREIGLMDWGDRYNMYNIKAPRLRKVLGNVFA